jgi:hypothetical protein
MHKYATLFAIATLTTGYATVRLIDEEAPASISMAEIFANDQKVREMVVSYRCFKATFQSTIESLRRGEVSLTDAKARVHEAANQHHPKFLPLLSMMNPGQSVDECLVRNLVGHVRSLEEFRPTDPSPLPRLEAELQDLLRAMEK